MLKNYLKIALRNLQKHKGYTVINVAGLSLGIAAATLIFLFARNELTYDRFHTRADDIYLVYKERVTQAGTQPTYDTWVPLLERMQAEFPTIDGGTRMADEEEWVEHDGQRFEESVAYVDPSFFEIFTFPLQRGDAANPLPHNNAAVVSQEIATKYFGNDDPLGKVITVDYQVDYTVTGVLARVPENSLIQPEILIPIRSAPEYDAFLDRWDVSFLNTYVRLAEGASVEALTAQFPAFVTNIWDEETAARTHFKMLPLLDANDTFTGNRDYAYILLVVALATILIACINFVNLATARSLERAREIGLRKVLGAVRGQLIAQFLGESILMGLVALVIGIEVAQVLLPSFNELFGLELTFDFFGDPLTLGALLGLGLIVGLLSGGYPAVFLSRFQPAQSLRGTFKTSRRGLRLRHTLVVVQFTLSIVLIAGTGVMWSQVQYMKHRDLAFNQDNVLVLPVEVDDFADAEEAAARLQTFKDELAQLSGVRSVASSTHVPGNGSESFTFVRPEGGDDDKPTRLRWAAVDARFFDTYDIDFVEGRNFAEGSETDRRQAVIINEAALRDFGWTSANGKFIRPGTQSMREIQVVGVVRDYNFQSLQDEVAPVLHIYRPPDGSVHDLISIKIQTSDVAATVNAIGAAWNRLDPTRPFDYFFVDENFDQLYRVQDRLVAAASAFSILAILIACLGLFGLASLMVAQRTREIGVRKVLGASASRITLLLSKDFTKLVAVAFVVGTPVTYLAMNRWLENFAYRVDIAWWIFLLAGLIALLVAFLTVSYQSIKAALANPMKALRHE